MASRSRSSGTRVKRRSSILTRCYCSTPTDGRGFPFGKSRAPSEGVGTKLVDQLTREERFVFDVAASNTLRPLDTLLAFVLDCGDVSFFGGIHALPFAPREAADVVAEARKICRVRTRRVAKSKLRDIDVQLDIIDLWRGSQEAFLSRPMPTLTNTDGDAFAITTDEYELLAPRDRITSALESIEGVQEAKQVGNDLEFVVTKRGNARQESWSETVIGRVLLTSSGRLRIETNSIRRVDTLRASVEEKLERLVRYRLRSEANTEQLLANANTSKDRANSERELPPPEILAKMREYREQHMTRWLDDSIPALGGMTPREAVGNPKQRKALEVLLKSFEHSEARLPEEERIDIGRLRRALGLR